jgi:hypothetical protein
MPGSGMMGGDGMGGVGWLEPSEAYSATSHGLERRATQGVAPAENGEKPPRVIA